MSWLDAVVRPFWNTQKRKRADPDAVTNSLAAVVPMWAANRPREAEYDLRQMVDDAYRKNALIHACVQEIAQSVSEPDLVVRVAATKAPVEDDHPLQKLLKRPHPDFSKLSLFELLLIHLQCTGEAYLHKGRSKFGNVVRLSVLRPDRMKPIPTEDGTVQTYEYRPETARAQLLPRADVIPFQLPDPLNDYRGLSPLMAAARFAEVDSEAAIYLRDFFLNGAVPAGLLVLKTPVRREERLRMKEEWHESFGRGTVSANRTNWHQVAVMNAEDVEYKDIGVTPEKLRMDSLWGITETRICMCFQVPPIIVQAKIGLDRLTYSQYETAYKAFWNDTLRPMYGRIDERLTSELATEFDESGELEIAFDLQNVAILQEGADARVARAVQLWTSGLVTRNEAREKYLGLDVLKGDDAMMMPQGVASVEKATSLVKAEEAPQPGAAPGLPPGAPGAPALPFGPPERKALLPPEKGKGAAEDEDEAERQAKVVPIRPGVVGALALRAETLEASPTNAVIDRLKPGFKLAFLSAARKLQRSVDMPALEDAISKRDREAAMRAVPLGGWSEVYGPLLKRHLTAVAQRMAGAVYPPHEAGERIGEFAEQRAAEELDRTGRDVRAAVAVAVDGVLASDLEAKDAARVVRSCLGLTERQARAVVSKL